MSYPRNAASPPPLFATVVKASDGTAITSAVAAKYSTGAGSQAAGSGTCQHEGNGQWSYTPTQAETNVTGFGVQFYHADAVGNGPTISVVTSADVAQTGDVYALVTNATYGLDKLARTGADGDTLKTLSDQVDGIEAGSGLTAQETANAVHNLAPAGTPAAGSVGAKLNNMPATILATAIAANDDTPGTVGYLLSLLAGLDFTQVNLVAASNAGEITIKRTLTLAAVVSGLTIPADWTACYWTVKRSVDDADADALAQVVVSNPPDAEDGLQVLAGAAVEDQTAGSLTVNQALGTVTIALDDASTAALEDAVELVWDVKVHAPGGKTQPGSGTATITTAVTRA